MTCDLTAAFDTVDQRKLLNNLHDEIGIRGKALSWFRYFLLDRTQMVKIGNTYSREEPLDYGVPQGSVLGPVLFNIYTRSFLMKVESIGYEVEGFADDRQLWKQFCPFFQVNVLGATLDNCFKSISSWKDEFFLRLNSTKTKILGIAPPSMKRDMGPSLTGNAFVLLILQKNLGILLDSELSFSGHIRRLVPSCFLAISFLMKAN